MRKSIISHLITKKILLSIFFTILLFISGCGNNSSDMKTIDVKHFQIDIPDTFKKISGGVIENKQIVNKVISSYKEKKEGFSPNIVITESNLSTKLDFEQFRTANTAKLKNFVTGYTPGNKELISFYCGEKRIQGIFVTFQIKDTFFKKKQIYAISQYQFVEENKGYIISTAYINQSEEKNLKKRLKTLHCK